MLYKIGLYLQRQINKGYLICLLRIDPYSKRFFLLFLLFLYFAFEYKSHFYLKKLFEYLAFSLITLFMLLNFKKFDSLVKPFRLLTYFSLIFITLFNILFFFNLFRY